MKNYENNYLSEFKQEFKKNVNKCKTWYQKEGFKNILLFTLLILNLACDSKKTSNSNLVFKPDPGPGDCYNRVSRSCNKRFPGKNLGDKVYRDCINNGLHWCDLFEPLKQGQPLPTLGADSRFEVRKN